MVGERKISFNTAKLAKEKNIRIGSKSSFCEYHSKYIYDGDATHPESHKKGEIREESDFFSVNNDKNFDVSSKHYTIYERPTQTLLHNFIIKNYGHYVLVIPTVTSNWTYKTIRVIADLDNDVITGLKSVDSLPPYTEVCGEDFSTHEDALEDALQKILKQI